MTWLKKKSIMKKGFTILVLVFWISGMFGQDYDVGIRAGLNYAKFGGPSESGVNESFDFSSGFHFGINFQWNFNNTIGLKGEVMYSQIGSQYNYDDEGFYVFDFVNTRTTVERFVVKDRSNVELDISNAHVSFPITANITLNEKFEVFGGFYTSFLVSPIGIGTWTFGTPGENAPDYAFQQTLDYAYNSDLTSFNVATSFFGSNQTDLILIIANDQDVDLARRVGAYFLLPQDHPVDDNNRPETKRFSGFDYGFIGGASYYVNKGLYLSARLEYGMTDITNAAVDYSLKNVNPDGSLIFNDDFDRNINIALSVGFRF